MATRGPLAPVLRRLPLSDARYLVASPSSAVKYWYLLPPYVGILVAHLGLGLRLYAEGRNLWGAVAGIAAVTCIFVLVWIANEVYGVRHIERLKRELSLIEERES